MGYQNQKLKILNKNIKLSFTLKSWIGSFIKIFLKKGEINKCITLLHKILCRLISIYGNLNFFFKIFKKRLFLPIYFRSRVVAGKKNLIPIRLAKGKELLFMWRLILDSCKKRVEFRFEDKIFLELLDIFKNKGLTIKRRVQICKDIKNNSPNLRFLKFN